MLGHFWDLLALASPNHASVERDARLLRRIIVMLAAAIGLTLAFEWFMLVRPPLRGVLWASLALLAVAYARSVRGAAAEARVVVMVVVLGIVSFGTYTSSSGIHSVTVIMYPSVIVLASLVLGRRGFLLLTCLTIASAGGLVLADVHGVITTRYHDVATYRDMIAPTGYLLFTALLVRVLAARLVRIVERAARHEQALAAANLDLAEHRVALDQSESRWQTYIENASDLLFGLDAQGRFAWVNRAVCERLGFTPGEVIGRPAVEVLAPDSRPIAAEAIRRTFAGEPVHRVELEARTRDGASVFLDVRGTRHVENGVPTSTFSIGRDITQRVEGEARRRRSEAREQQLLKFESLGVLAGGIAHDFNNLLVAMLGNLDMALDELPQGHAAREYVNQAGDASRRAAELTRIMLAFSGRGRFAIARIEIGALLRDMASELMAVVSPRAKLTITAATGLPPIAADVGQIRQAITNLVVNASESLGDAPGSIMVSSGVAWYTQAELADEHLHTDPIEGRYVWVQVDDSGAGLAADVLPRIFDPFFSTKFTGRGLGLPAVLGIVRGHRGSIKVSSQPGRGASFRLLLPVAPEPGENGAAGAPPA
jgi:PAS domain S-box-containing protein